MTNFLDLPREIRDMIYGFALTSPTSRYLASLQKNRPLPTLPTLPTLPATCVRLQPCSAIITRPVRCSSPSPNMALKRTCKQVYEETRDWIWEHNTIVFASASDVLAVLKRMGQRPSRRIRKVVLHVEEGWDDDKTSLLRALSMLASRTRKGELRDVRLVIDIGKEYVMPNSPLTRRMMGGESAARRAKNTIYWLRKGAAAGWAHARVKRTLEVRYHPRTYGCDSHAFVDDYYDILDTILADCHHAWAGQVICAGRVVYESGLKVAEIPMAPPSAAKRIYP